MSKGSKSVKTFLNLRRNSKALYDGIDQKLTGHPNSDTVVITFSFGAALFAEHRGNHPKQYEELEEILRVKQPPSLE